MMARAQRDGELITDLAAKRAVLGEAQVVGVCRPAPTNQARLFGNELDVLLVTKAAWLRMGQPALVNTVGIRCPCGPQRPLPMALTKADLPILSHAAFVTKSTSSSLPNRRA